VVTGDPAPPDPTPTPTPARIEDHHGRARVTDPVCGVLDVDPDRLATALRWNPDQLRDLIRAYRPGLDIPPGLPHLTLAALAAQAAPPAWTAGPPAPSTPAPPARPHPTEAAP
jgi:hypothetical protein